MILALAAVEKSLKNVAKVRDYLINTTNLPAKKNREYATSENYTYWIDQIRAGNDVDFYFDKIIVDINPYFTVLARSFARSTDYSMYDDYMQEAYLLTWKIIKTREFDNFFAYTTRAFFYGLTNHYHDYMRSKLKLYYYLIEVGKRIPWDDGYTQHLLEYQERQREKYRLQGLKIKEREEEKRKRKAKNHEKYLRSRERQLAYRVANREKKREYYRKYYQDNKEKVLAHNRKWAKNNKEKIREYGRKYREEHPEKYADNQKRYKENHPNAARDAQRRYRERNPRPLKKPGSKLQAPYGYRKGRAEIWILDRKQAPTVRQIFNWCLAGNGSIRIVKLLKEKGIKSPRGKEMWAPGMITHILRDERYTGRLTVKPNSVFGKGLSEEVTIENYFPVIISEEDFWAVSEELKRKTYR